MKKYNGNDNDKNNNRIIKIMMMMMMMIKRIKTGNRIKYKNVKI